ncbi:multidrug transporter [Marinobacter sp. chi1]|uniref:Multidrug transporter n=1 Tax=Marinobacter suaedae TaxID=3057675 RepID=A0ABT8W250_9GAMM|nr:multidrug transporter [Marinobacter sp. chi1]MDO3722305.1 multidrug transporter [Marinobacter sp. chi1]
MSQEFSTILLAAVGAVLFVGGLLFFLRPSWLLGWLKGMAVFGIMAIGAYLLVIALNLYDYQSLSGMQTVASVSTQEQGDQRWGVAFELVGQEPVVASLRGDQWQVDARIIRFTGPLRWLGIGPAYRLERLGGRYTSLEQERSNPRSVIGLNDAVWVDLWELDRQFDLPFVEGVYGNATFMPMRDGAVFDVRLSGSGLVAVPANEEAHKAVQYW